jgi:AraC-like DNA-binding protein
MVARHVGYETPSAFVAAFRRETGLTPAAYFSHRGAPIVIDAAEDKPSRRGA